MNVVERKYNATCSLYENRVETDPETNVTSAAHVLVESDIPCRLVVESAPPTTQKDGAAQVTQSITLLLSPGIPVKPGSNVVVTQDGWTASYFAAGMPEIYTTHQEVPLKLERWA